MLCVWMLQRGYSGDECVLASTLCKYDLRKGDLFVLSWARVRRVRRGSLSSELLMCGGGVHNILLLPLVARCLETIDVCIWRMFVLMSVVVTVWGSMGIFGSNDLSLHEVELSGNCLQLCQQIEINSYPDSPLFISTGFLPRVSLMRLN